MARKSCQWKLSCGGLFRHRHCRAEEAKSGRELDGISFFPSRTRTPAPGKYVKRDQELSSGHCSLLMCAIIRSGTDENVPESKKEKKRRRNGLTEYFKRFAVAVLHLLFRFFFFLVIPNISHAIVVVHLTVSM